MSCTDWVRVLLELFDSSVRVPSDNWVRSTMHAKWNKIAYDKSIAASAQIALFTL